MKTNFRTFYLYLILFLLAGLIIIPLYVSVIGGFKHTGELRTNSLGLPLDWKFENYTSLLGSSDFWLFLWNSTVYAVGTTFFVVLFAKGQLVSKGLVAILNSSKKRTKKFDLQSYNTAGRLVFVRFLEELKTAKLPFDIK